MDDCMNIHKSKKYAYRMLQVHQFTLIWDEIDITGTFHIRFWWLYNKHMNRGKITEIAMMAWMTMNYSWTKQINVDPILSIKIYYISLRCRALLVSFQLCSVIFSLGDDLLFSGCHFVGEVYNNTRGNIFLRGKKDLIIQNWILLFTWDGKDFFLICLYEMWWYLVYVYSTTYYTSNCLSSF